MKILILGLLFTTQLFAGNIFIEKKDQCVPASLTELFEILISYDKYSSLPGAQYDMHTSIMGDIRLLSMVKSQSQFTSQSAQNTDALLWLVLQPTNLTEAELYPRFLSRCVSVSDGDNKINHSCLMDATKQHFGINSFQSHLTIVDGDPKCAQGQALVSYQVQIDSNDADIDQIKDKVLGKAGILAPILKGMFNNEVFIRSYFENFYQKLLETKK